MKKIHRTTGGYFMGPIGENDLEQIKVAPLDNGESIDNEDFHVLETPSQNASDDEAEEIPDIDTSSSDDVCFRIILFSCNNYFTRPLFYF